MTSSAKSAWKFIGIMALFLIGLGFGAVAYPQQNPLSPVAVDWPNRGLDQQGSGWNRQEKVLTQAYIRKNGLRVQAFLPVAADPKTNIGDRIGMETQPLIATGLKVAKGTVTGLFYTSMANVAQMRDYSTGEAIWQTTLGRPVCVSGNDADCRSPKIDMHQINDHWGALSTGLYVKKMGAFFQSAWVSVDGSGTPQSARYFLFKINATDGKVLGKVMLQGTETSMWKQRLSLGLMDFGADAYAVIGHGSVYETFQGYTGGLDFVNLRTMQVIDTAKFRIPEGIWEAGAKVSIYGRCAYVTTGNGDFSPANNWYGESDLRVCFDGKYTTVPYRFSPFTDKMLTGQENVPVGGVVKAVSPHAMPDHDEIHEGKLAGESELSEAVRPQPVGQGMVMAIRGARVEADINDQGEVVTRVYPTQATGPFGDQDRGSAGPSCIPQIGFCLSVGKHGIGYVWRMDATGGTTVQNVGTQANYNSLPSAPVWATMSPGNVSPTPDDPKTLNFLPNGVTSHNHAVPVPFYDPLLKTWCWFVWGENARLHKWAVDRTGKLTYIAEGLVYSSADARGRTPGGMPGGFCTGSSNGDDPDSALLFCLVPYGDANSQITAARLLVYDPVHLDNTKHLQELWDSQDWGIVWKFNKFMNPVVDSKVVIPTFDGRLLVMY